MSTSRKLDNLQSETTTDVISRFAVMTEEEISQMLAFLECVVRCCIVTKFVYASTIILFDLGE